MANAFIKKIKFFVNESKNFSSGIILLRAIIDRTKKLKLNDSVKSALYEKKHSLVLSFLSAEFGGLIDKYKSLPDPTEGKQGDTIWTCWWQGEESATPLVKKCIESIRINAGNHPVVLIDKDNWSDYVEIPEHIKKKFDEGIIPIPKLANVIRNALLNKYGGIWLDGTVFTFNPIPEDVFSMPIFTCKQIRDSEVRRFISQTGTLDNWANNMIGGRAGHPLFMFLSEYFSEYWKKFSSDIDYLWYDYGIRLAYENFPAVKRDIDAVPLNCADCFGLFYIMNDAYSPEAVKALANNGTMFYKLVHENKFQYKSHTDTGKETVYHRFIQENGFEK